VGNEAVTAARAKVEELERLLHDLATLREVTQASYDEARRDLDRLLNRSTPMAASPIIRTPRRHLET
jgi:hypothetical protein